MARAIGSNLARTERDAETGETVFEGKPRSLTTLSGSSSYREAIADEITAHDSAKVWSQGEWDR